MENLWDKYKKYVMPTYAPKLMIARGKGSYVWDEKGNRFLDFASGISVCNLGHCHSHITAAVCDQAQKLVHVSNLYCNEVTPLLAEKLVSKCFDGVVFFANSGAEANEGMIKFARKIGNEKNKNEIISMNNSFHGRTLATLAATGRAKYRIGFNPDMPGFKQVEFNDFEGLKNAVTDKTCAIMLEPVQGEGGIIPADLEYLKKVRALCDEKGILLLFDEVQCGMGRTGTMFAFQNFGVEPDAVSLAKAIANGLPMGAFIVKRKYAETLTVGMHASTFGGSALVSRAALAVLEVFEQENVLENCKKMSEYLNAKLLEIGKKYSFVLGTRSLGLMVGLVMNTNAAPLAEILIKHNLIVLTAGETVLRLLPPLNISVSEADEALEKIELGLAEFAGTLVK